MFAKKDVDRTHIRGDLPVQRGQPAPSPQGLRAGLIVHGPTHFVLLPNQTVLYAPHALSLQGIAEAKREKRAFAFILEPL